MYTWLTKQNELLPKVAACTMLDNWFISCNSEESFDLNLGLNEVILVERTSVVASNYERLVKTETI